MKRSFIIELLIITLVGCIAFAVHAPTLPPVDPSPALLDLNPITRLLTDTSIRPIGLEHERLAGVIIPIRVGLQRYGHIPFWNSYLSNGVPLINNAFSYLFNPFHSLPILILGGVTGSKFAILIALLIAGYNMWAFGLAIGLGAVARVTTALLYLLNGSLIAKFGAGHFQLACSLAWPPLVFATTWWTLRSSKRLAPVTLGISFALLFYAGNIYYVLHTSICCMVIVALHLIEHAHSRWHIRRDRLQRIGIAAVIAFGLCALQFFPIWQTRDFVTHEQQEINIDGTLANSYDFAQSVTNLTQPYQYWVFHHPANMFDAVDYAYIGHLVIVLIALAIALYITRRVLRKPHLSPVPYQFAIFAAVILALLMMLWAGGQTQPLPWLYANVPLLAQFRFLGRALSIAALWWILLAGIALDTLWNAAHAYLVTHLSSYKRLTIALAIASAAWFYLFIYSASNGPSRITMVFRNVAWWKALDALRYSTLTAALHSLTIILLVVATIDIMIQIAHYVRSRLTRKQTASLRVILAHTSRMTLLGIVALGLLDTIIVNIPTLQFSPDNIPFDTIYDDIRRVDPNTPVPAVSLPFSPFTFGAYEREVRIWSLNEGWSPAAPANSALIMNRFSNPSRWLIAERTTDGTLRDSRAEANIQSTGYELRACYVTDQIMQISNCSVRKTGFNLYEFPQALPYAFIVSDPVLTTNPTRLHANQVTPADVFLYQQDNIIIHASYNSADFDKHYLVVQEANFPGWHATIDGLPIQPITVPTYFIGQQTLGLIAIPTQKGDHTYTLHFDPPGLSTGILVFCGTLILILVYTAYRPKQKSPA